MEQLEIVRESLGRLMRSERSDSFVIIEEVESNKFVQFVSNQDEPLLLDLPNQTLSEVEFYKAVKYFGKLGVKGGEHEVLDMPGGDMIGEQYSFNMSIGSPEEAAQITTAIFREIYGMPESIELKISENV